MKVLPLLLLLFSPFIAFYPDARQTTETAWTKEELKMANTAGNVSYLTGEEKDIVIYLNLARMNGEKFFNTYFQDFVEENNRQMLRYGNYDELKIDRNSSYYRSLKRDLQNIRNLSMYYPDEALSKVARAHANDLNRNNLATHNSSNGRTVMERIGKIYPKRSNGENLAFGFSSGLANVCMLLLDKGVPDLGHRKIILDTSYNLNTVGVSIQPHKKYRYCAVIDFVSLPE